MRRMESIVFIVREWGVYDGGGFADVSSFCLVGEGGGCDLLHCFILRGLSRWCEDWRVIPMAAAHYYSAK